MKITFTSTFIIFGLLLCSFTYHKQQHQDCKHHTGKTLMVNEGDEVQSLLSKIDFSKGLKTIVIDAGHGGKDSGCHGAKKTYEKHITLKIALKLGKYIEDAYPSLKVIYTRKKDVFIPLFERAHLANKHKADLFISIHCNAVPKLTKKGKRVQGTETYVMGLHTTKENLDVAKRENEVILLEKNYKKNYDGFDPNSPEGHIMLSMYQDAYQSQSINLAEKIDKQFKVRAKRISRGVKQAGFVVLRQTTMPSVLVEAGFLTNISEEKFLKTDYGQNLIASGIYRAFKEYKEEIDPIKTIGVSKGSEKFMSAPTPKFAKGVIYKVQLGASSKLVNLQSQPWAKVKQIEVQKIKGIHKYLVGEYPSYKEVLKAQKYWKGKGFKDAFVVAYQDGNRIAVSKAKKLKGE
jgi:N-acetylmuramoyl-L-alanine amidase